MGIVVWYLCLIDPHKVPGVALSTVEVADALLALLNIARQARPRIILIVIGFVTGRGQGGVGVIRVGEVVDAGADNSNP